jgi:DNA-binding transcriptional MerR regulator
MKMQKRQFRIGQLAKELAVERFVIRFWEKEFGVACERSQGGQRFYDGNDLERFKYIKTLLYDKGYTIAGAKKCLESEDKTKIGEMLGSHKTTFTTTAEQDTDIIEQLVEQLVHLQKQLLKLRSLL